MCAKGGHGSEVAQGKHWWELYGLEKPMVAEAQGIHQRHHIQHAYLALLYPSTVLVGRAVTSTGLAAGSAARTLCCKTPEFK